jgi:uncharacterized membrane protein YccF (DUF307 family)
MDSVGEELERLARLRASGDLTDGEFEILKARLIGTEPNAPAPSEQIPIPTTEEVEEDGVEDMVPVEDLLPVLEAARGELVAYEVTDWTSEEQAAFSEILTELGVSHEFDEEGDLVVSPPDEETVDQAMDEFFDTTDEWVDPEDEAAKVAQDSALVSLETQRAEGEQVATQSDRGAVSVGDGVNLSVNVTQAAAAPQVVVVAQSNAPHFLVRVIWFLCVGWWLSGFVMMFAWFMAATIVGLPIAFATFNRVPMVQTLRPRTITTRVTTEGGVTVVTQGTVDQLAMWVRAIWFVFVGWWVGLIVTVIAWVASVLVITLPLSIILIDRLPAVMTLQKN